MEIRKIHQQKNGVVYITLPRNQYQDGEFVIITRAKITKEEVAQTPD